ncbi:hypothetical protein DUI87_09429 [Hirundo rustica rustica]|uniref:Uncharacterized protein n=1 Tax=Hirundo rustica rustica TaxID=333673 RepID=A0A3M0KMK8_HIRRU|nr:hypothetical protein DUI87_09429 [Hirundo rustica rustica]
MARQGWPSSSRAGEGAQNSWAHEQIVINKMDQIRKIKIWNFIERQNDSLGQPQLKGQRRAQGRRWVNNDNTLCQSVIPQVHLFGLQQSLFIHWIAERDSGFRWSFLRGIFINHAGLSSESLNRSAEEDNTVNGWVQVWCGDVNFWWRRSRYRSKNIYHKMMIDFPGQGFLLTVDSSRSKQQPDRPFRCREQEERSAPSSLFFTPPNFA